MSELVVQSAEGYQQLLDRIEYLETTAGIRQGLDELAAGQAVAAIPALEALKGRVSILYVRHSSQSWLSQENDI